MKIGLVLAGGIGKGAYQAGFLKAFKEEFGDSNEVVAISASSIGLLGAYALAADKIDLLSEMWRKIHFESTADIMYSVWHSNFLREIIYELTDPSDELQMPIYAPVLLFPAIHASWSKMEGKYHKQWPRFMVSGSYIPLVCGGLKFWHGNLAFDGGGIDLVPLLPLVKQYKDKIDLIFVLHFNPEFKPRREYTQAGIPIIEYDISLYCPHRTRSFDFHSDTLTDRIKNGYDYGKKICSELFARGQNSVEDTLAAAARHHEEERERRLNSLYFNKVVVLNNILHPFLATNKPIRVHTFKYPNEKKLETHRKKEQKKREKKAKKMQKVYDKMLPHITDDDPVLLLPSPVEPEPEIATALSPEKELTTALTPETVTETAFSAEQACDNSTLA